MISLKNRAKTPRTSREQNKQLEPARHRGWMMNVSTLPGSNCWFTKGSPEHVCWWMIFGWLRFYSRPGGFLRLEPENLSRQIFAAKILLWTVDFQTQQRGFLREIRHVFRSFVLRNLQCSNWPEVLVFVFFGSWLAGRKTELANMYVYI